MVKDPVFKLRSATRRAKSDVANKLENWAFLDWVPGSNPGVEEIRMDDPDLQQALQLHALQLGP